MLDGKGNAIKELCNIKVGEIIDRYGPSNGRYVSPINDNEPYSYEKRSLPYVEEPSNYHKYKVIGDFAMIAMYISNCTDTKLRQQIDAYIKKNYDGDIDKLIIYSGEIALVDGWGLGGGVQYEFPLTIEWLIKLGLLVEIE